MRALVVDPTLAQPPKRRFGGRTPVQHFPVEVREIGTPVPPAPGWALVRPGLAGICGTDVALLQGLNSPSVLSAYDSPGPVVPGHEVVGVVERAAGTRWARDGQRVIVEPTLRCVHKGLPECRRCQAGDTHLCENRDRAGALCSGPAIGSSERAGGGWSEGFLVHEDMLLPADGISDQRGVLAEPAAAALHAALRWQRRGDQAVVIGSDTQSRLIVASLRRLHPDLDITLLYDSRSSTRDHGGRRGRKPMHQPADQDASFAQFSALGASRVRRGHPMQLLLDVAAQTGARAMRPHDGGMPVLDGGVDAVFDCVSSVASIDLGMRLLRGGGTLVQCSRSERLEAEWPLLWARELTVIGSSRYGREKSGHRTFAVVREWLSDATFPVDALVTHRFPLEEYEAALETATAGVTAGAVKVVFQGSAASLRPRAEDDVANIDLNGDEPLLLHATAARTRAGRRP